ncbi:DNA alkylation repair protein [Adlercreutzia sp. R21]|uniref:DNA alkylation repair protein n=1 Tax=Adlercreutzia wanghongyangiae TaxID=3111451 RepID=UPI002DB7F754|nr:DNA alkylation repair protein [Adlercreutzia sp. R21]MEC4183286.1 DNA alkylation repair protein [Adlercreutzia sp. R21]
MAIQEDVGAFLASHADEGYRAFQAKLIPNIGADIIVGVRTPDLRRFAKALARRGDAGEFLAALPHGTFEENQLHSFIIAQERDFDKLVGEIERFLPFVDNWATCDQLSCRGLAADPDVALGRARHWLESDHEYTVRFAIGVLMELFLEERFRPELFQWVVGVSRPEYYVNMMRAWYFAEALAKQPVAAEEVIASGALDTWTHNKAIQKVVESRRISPEQKDRLRAMRRRSS